MELSKSRNGLMAEIKLTPPVAWVLAAVAFIGAQIFFDVVMGRQAHSPTAWVLAAMGLAAGLVLGGYLLLIGYVSRDARRRGMSPVLWTLVAIIIPNGLGILLYFILRQPLPKGNAQVATTLATEFTVCPRCGYQPGRSCPQCQRVVDGDDAYCRYCGTSLA